MICHDNDDENRQKLSNSGAASKISKQKNALCRDVKIYVSSPGTRKCVFFENSYFLILLLLRYSLLQAVDFHKKL